MVVKKLDKWPLGISPRIVDPIPKRMDALTIRRDQYGPPMESLKLEEVQVPRLYPEEGNKVLAAVVATGPNFNTNFASLALPVPVFGRGKAARCIFLAATLWASSLTRGRL